MGNITNSNKRFIFRKNKYSVLTILVIVLIAGIGVYMLAGSRAAGPYVSSEVESGSMSAPAAVISDSTASGGSAIEFNQPTTTTAYPTFESTGPRVAPTSTAGSITTTHDGQLIERVTVNGSIDIRHNNVIIRDVVIMGTGNYSLDIGQNTTPCPSNILVEYTEINMINAPAHLSMPLYDRCAGGTRLDHLRIHNQGRGILTYGNVELTNSYIHNQRTYTDAHRSAWSTHGGSNYTVRHNTIICEEAHCSAAVVMYSDYAPVTNYLLEDNLVAGGSICVRGGETHSYPNDTHDIRVINNRFSTRFFPGCGSLQAFAQFDDNAPGNVRSGNVYHESGLPIPGE